MSYDVSFCLKKNRNKAQDYIYQEELEAYESDGLLTLYTAFSRDQPEKVSVTNFLKETFLKDEIIKLDWK